MDSDDFAAGRKIGCPLLLPWGATGGVGRNQKSMEIWPRYAADTARKAPPCGHYLSRKGRNLSRASRVLHGEGLKEPRVLLMTTARRPWYTVLYIQVLLAIALGIIIGHFFRMPASRSSPR